MAGLLQQGMNPQQPSQAPQQAQRQNPQQPPQQPPQQGAQAQEQGRGRNPMAPPEQAKPMVAELVDKLLNFLYEDGLEGVAQALQKEGDIKKVMGEVLGMIMVTVYNSLAQAGKTIPPNVMVQAGMELSKAVGEMAMEMGRLPKENNAEAIESAFMLGLGKLGKNADKSAMSPEERQAYRQIVEALMSGREKAMGGRSQGQGKSQTQPAAKPQGEMRPPQTMNGGQ